MFERSTLPPLFSSNGTEVIPIRERSKYNVGRDVSGRTYDGIVFDSAMEMKYYRDVVLPGLESGDIVKFERQKPYTLQPKFTHGNVKVRAIVYVADFYIVYSDGREVVIDIKGAADSLAKCKRKLFWYTHPEVDYIWLTYVKKYGGWVDWDEANQRRRAERKLRMEHEEEEDNGEE